MKYTCTMRIARQIWMGGTCIAIIDHVMTIVELRIECDFGYLLMSYCTPKKIAIYYIYYRFLVREIFSVFY